MKEKAWKRVLRLSNPRKSLRARLCCFAGLITLVFWVILVWVIVILSERQLTVYRGLALGDVAQDMAQSIDKALFERLREIENLARLPIYPASLVLDQADAAGGGQGALDAAQYTLDHISASNEYYSWIGIVGTNGVVLVSSPFGVLVGRNLSATTMFASALNGQAYTSNLLSGRILQDNMTNPGNHTMRVLDIAAPIIGYKTNQTIGVVCAFLNWDWVMELEASLRYSAFSYDAELFIFNASSSIALAPSNYNYVPRVPVPLPWLAGFLQSHRRSEYFNALHWLSPANTTHSVKSNLVVGVAKCNGYREFAGMPWVVAITLPEKVVLAPVTAQRNQTIICGLVFWVALTIVLICLSTQVVSPLTRTSEVAKLMLDGQSGGYASPSIIEECSQEQDDIVERLWMRDEVYVLCQMVRVLARTFLQQKILAQTMEQRIMDRTSMLQKEIRFREQVQETAEAAQREAEAAEAAKSRFLANMSHEIRTPMNGILGTIQLLFETPLLEDQYDYVRTMKYSADSLLSIINDVLMFSKLESNHFQLRASAFQMEHVFEGVGELLGPLCAERGLASYFIVDPAVNDSLVGDYGRLQQVLINLAGNSLKFTSYPGEIMVVCSTSCSTCYLRSIFNATEASPFQHGGGPHTCTSTSGRAKEEQRGEEGVMLEFEVRDTGCGISQEQVGRLFTPFFQADSSTTRSTGGTGLGLSICKQLVELFGGTVNVSSYLGIGSSFRFSARFQIPSLAMLRTASILSRRAIENSARVSPTGNARNSSAKSINNSTKRVAMNNSNPNNSNNLSRTISGKPGGESENAKDEQEQKKKKRGGKPTPTINLMVTTTSNRQSFTTTLGNTESFGVVRTTSRDKYSAVEPQSPIELCVTNSGDTDKEREIYVEQEQLENEQEEEEEKRWVLITSDRVTFLRVVAQRIEIALGAGAVHTKTCAAQGRELADVLAAGVDGKPFLAAVFNPDHLLSSIESLFANSSNRFRNCGLIGVCPMGAAPVRKRLSTLGVRHLPTPVCLPKLVRLVDVVIRAGMQRAEGSPTLHDELTLRPTYSTTANFMRSTAEEEAAQALVRSLVSPARLIPPSPRGAPASPKRTANLRFSGEFLSANNNNNNNYNNNNNNSFANNASSPLSPHLSLGTSSPSSSSHPTPTSPSSLVRPLCVLVAEDNKTNMMILTKYLQKTGTGVKVVQANDGAEALAEVRAHPPGYFSLILMDLHMPNMDGLQATRQIRKWEKEQMVIMRPRAHSAGSSDDLQPLLEARAHGSARNYAQMYTLRPHASPVHTHALRIIALTADVMPGVSEECVAAGMDGFLTKPLDYRNLLRVVQEVCEKVRAQDAANV